MKTKAIYERDVLKPIGEFDLKGGEEEEIELQTSVVDGTYAVSKLSDEIIAEIIVTTENGE